MDFNEVDRYANTFTREPEFKCPACGTELHTDWVDNGFGPYSVQASPYGCECGWHETGCVECIKEKCFSWAKCHGKALIKVNPAVQDGVIINMTTDPNVKQAEEVKDQPADLQPASEQATEQESAEEGTTEG